CQLDANYVFSAPSATTDKLNFPGFKASGAANDTANCTNATGTGATTFSATSGTAVPVENCLFSSSTQNTSTNVTNTVDWALTVAPEDPEGPTADCFGAAAPANWTNDGTATNASPTSTDACSENVDGNPASATG